MRIVVGVDSSASAEDACQFVAGRSWPVGSSVELVAALESPRGWTGLVTGGSEELERGAELEAILQDRARLLRSRGLTASTTVERSDAATTITRRAEETYAQLIVVGSRCLGPIASAVLGVGLGAPCRPRSVSGPRGAVTGRNADAARDRWDRQLA